jgi:hypothetical protein
MSKSKVQKRNFPNFIDAFIEYSSILEAPTRMYFWTAVSTLSGCLRRKVWIGGHHFKWYPNFFVVFVAPPGIISKSVTASIGMELLRKVDGVFFGPSVVTWQALVSAIKDAEEIVGVDYEGNDIKESCLTIESSELGNLFDPDDRDKVDMFITLWDGKSFDKATKSGGLEVVTNPWLNVIACTTPSWLKSNCKESIIEGGFTSRCIFVYGTKKRQYVAMPWKHEPKEIEATKRLLIQDLQYINDNIKGRFTLDKKADEFAEDWYASHCKMVEKNYEVEKHQAHIARLQSNQFKLSMVLSAAERDDLLITEEIIKTATSMIMDTSKDLPAIFNGLNQSDLSKNTDRLLIYIKQKGTVDYKDAYRTLHGFFPSPKIFEEAVYGLVMSGQIQQVNSAGKISLRYMTP